MTRNELSLAVALAQSTEELETFLGENSSERLCDLFNGFGLSDYAAVHITIRDLACLIRYECTQMNGELDNRALTEIAELGKSKFIIVGLGDDSIQTVMSAENMPHWYSVLV